MNKFRIYILLSVFTLSFIGLLVRLFYWQIVKGAELSQAATGQHKNNLILEAPRGEIFASDGSWLASRGELWTLTANPKEVSENPRELA
ncbi:MAG: Cell division protein FtsI/penicillin-binding protein 2, partial [uncultured bacterium]